MWKQKYLYKAWKSLEKKLNHLFTGISNETESMMMRSLTAVRQSNNLQFVFKAVFNLRVEKDNSCC